MTDPKGRRLDSRHLRALIRLATLKVRTRGRLRGGLCFLDDGAAVNLGPSAVIEYGPGVRALRDFTADVAGRLSIGEAVFFNRGCHVVARQEVVIGDRCLFGEKVSIHDEDHAFGTTFAAVPLPERPIRCRPVRIGSDVWVGAKATILSGVTIGDDVVVAAHAVVTRDIPPHSLVAGIPARVLRSWSTVPTVPQV